MNNSGSQIYLASIFIGPGIIDEQSICEPVSTGSIIYRFYDTDWMWSGKTSIGVNTIDLHLHLLCINQVIVVLLIFLRFYES